jgi:hypothetical protein
MGDGGIVSVGGCEGSGGRLGCMGCMAMEELGIQRVGWRAEETKRGLFWGTLTGMLRGDEQWGRAMSDGGRGMGLKGHGGEGDMGLLQSIYPALRLSPVTS